MPAPASRPDGSVHRGAPRPGIRHPAAPRSNCRAAARAQPPHVALPYTPPSVWRRSAPSAAGPAASRCARSSRRRAAGRGRKGRRAVWNSPRIDNRSSGCVLKGAGWQRLRGNGRRPRRKGCRSGHRHASRRPTARASGPAPNATARGAAPQGLPPATTACVAPTRAGSRAGSRHRFHPTVCCSRAARRVADALRPFATMPGGSRRARPEIRTRAGRSGGERFFG